MSQYTYGVLTGCTAMRALMAFNDRAWGWLAFSAALSAYFAIRSAFDE